MAKSVAKSPPGQKADACIAPGAAEAMRNAIAEAGGREVFFAGGLDKNGLVARITVRARGNEGAVPAIFETLERGDVVLHNHPSGDIAPSQADLDLAIVYSHNGHGVYIVDNDVTSVYVVVEPFRDKDVHPLDALAVARPLGAGGAVARVIPEFELRPQQTTMLEYTARAFNENAIAVIEAPTGVGKTMAYLLPAITWAVQNRERVVVSTRTINLQEQIVHKDIPALQRALDIEFSAVLVKGRQNYVCPRRLERALSEAMLFDDENDLNGLKAIAEWAEKTDDGSTADLPFVPLREVWEKVCSEADTCTAAQCQAAKKCFVAKARRLIAKADVIVVNHHMLFSDLAIKREMGDFNALAVLPAYRRLIIDEAHHIEDSATEYFGLEATRNGAIALIGRFIRMERNQERGLIPFLRIAIMKASHTLSPSETNELLTLIDERLLPALLSCREGIETAFAALRHLTAEKCRQLGRDIRWRLAPDAVRDPAFDELREVYIRPLVDEVIAVAMLCERVLEYIRDLPAAPDRDEPPFALEAAQIEAFRERFRRLAAALREGTKEEHDENTVRWIEIDERNPNIVRIVRCPLEVGEPLAETLYPNLKTLVMTSATLAVRGRFEFFARQIGLDRVEERDVNTVALESPFDFSTQTLVGVPIDGPAPDSPQFNRECAETIESILQITQGRAFVLFTSFAALNYVYDRLRDSLSREGIRVLKQGDANRNLLLEQFRTDITSVLFATDSFWEGVDVAGEALQCVILTKLPFRVPTEPLFQARAEAIEERGGNAFLEYTVPLAVVKFRQGFGRLIRRKTDRGVVVVLDPRIRTKPYGRVFLDSLPGARVVAGPRDAVLKSVQTFFDAIRPRSDRA